MKTYLTIISLCSLCLFASCEKKSAILSETARRDLQNIFIAGDRLSPIAAEVVKAREAVEEDQQLLAIKVNRDLELSKIGGLRSSDKADTETMFAKRDADTKQFNDALARFTEVQVTAKTKVDFLNLPNSPSMKSAMQEASTAWAAFRTTAEGLTAERAKVAAKLKSEEDSAATLFEKARPRQVNYFHRPSEFDRNA